MADIVTSTHRRRRRRRKPWYRRIRLVHLLYALVPVIVGVVLLSVLTADAISKINRSQNDLNVVMSSLENKPATDFTLRDYELIDESLQQLSEALVSANNRTTPIQLVSFLNSDLETRFEVMEAAIFITEGTRDFLAGLKPTVALLERGGEDDNDEDNDLEESSTTLTGTRSVDLLRAGRSRFLEAQAQINSARALLDEIDLNGVSSSTLLDVESLRDYVDQIDTYNSLALAAPELLEVALGFQGTQTYLVVAQNNDEIRPSGGYISTWGWMRVQDSKVQEYDYFPTTDTTPSPPDSSLADTLEIPLWWLQYNRPIYAAWDGSWYVDFSSTAQMSAWFYNNGENPFTPVDGVIGIDLVALEYLIQAIGDILVPDYDVVVNGANFRETVYAIRAEGAAEREHKAFLADLYRQVIEEWRKANAETKGNINRAILQAFREKHLLLYFADTAIENAVKELDWAGAQESGNDYDYLLVADANLGNKSSSSVQRQITYDVSLAEDNSINSSLSVFYNFPDSVASLDPAVQPEHYGSQKDYNSLFQVFTPRNSQLINARSSWDITTVNEGPRTLFTSLVRVPYDNSNRIELEYSSASVLQDIGDYKQYRLLLQKQPGIRIDGVIVTVSLPDDSTVISVEPEPTNTYELGNPVLEFDMRLLKDEWIEVIFSE